MKPVEEPHCFAYADPPYPGKSRKYYAGHEDYAGEVDHARLIDRLENEYPDGWALSTSANELQRILPLCPQPLARGAAGGGVRYQIRVLAWCKPAAQPGGYPSPLYGWEPVILRRGRRDPDASWPRDWLVCSPDLFTLREKPEGHVTGAKPDPFLYWLFACLGARSGDTLDDLFPGSRAVTRAWEAFTAQPSLFTPELSGRGRRELRGQAPAEGLIAAATLEIDCEANGHPIDGSSCPCGANHL